MRPADSRGGDGLGLQPLDALLVATGLVEPGLGGGDARFDLVEPQSRQFLTGLDAVAGAREHGVDHALDFE